MPSDGDSMGLRHFHIVFITVSIGLSVFVAVWGFREFLATRNSSALVLAIMFVFCGVALVAYAGRVFRKLMNL
ncbi:MAG: hypothetical protein ABI718_00585 [Acidobacteriota bacterium]